MHQVYWLQPKNGSSQLETKLLAIVFGCWRFDDYIYGKNVLAKTGHKSVVSIFLKILFFHSLSTENDSALHGL